MPREPRIHVPGGVYHVILRGNGRQPIFFVDRDRRFWMRLLADGICRYRCRIHAYCWMTNHLHMIVQVSDLPLGLLIGWAASQYARATNRRRNRSGHLFERRYRGKPILHDSYLLQLVRYIHLNPVVAGLAACPQHYPWSSHRAYLGYYRPRLLTTDWVLSQFGNERKQAVEAFRRFLATDDAVPGSQLGAVRSDDFLESHSDLVNKNHGPKRRGNAVRSLSALIREVCRENDIAEAELASRRRTRRNARLRAEIALAAQRQGIASVHEVAKRFNRSDSVISHAMRNLLHSSRDGGK